MSETALRTLIVDDEPLAIERMQVLCAELPGIAVVGAHRLGPETAGVPLDHVADGLGVRPR